MGAHDDQTRVVSRSFVQNLGLRIGSLADDDLNGVAADCGPDELPNGGTPFGDLCFLNNHGARHRMAERRCHRDDRRIYAHMQHRQPCLVPRAECPGIGQRQARRL